MQILRTNRIIFEWIGLFDSNDSKVKAVCCMCLVSQLLLLLPSIAYFVDNISDVGKATSAFYITCVLSLTHLKYLTYLHHKSLIRSIINDLEAIVKSSMERQGIYQITYEQTEKFTFCFVMVYLVAITLSMLAPLIVVIFHYLNGNYSPEVWALPTSLLMPFDVAQSPGYEISYLICILAAYSIVAVSAIEAFTFSVSLFIRATFSDLRVCLQQMDSELIARKKDKLPGNHAGMLKQIIQFHLKILNIVDKVNELLNELKYIIFSFGLIILCTALYQLQENVLDGSQESIQCLAVCACDAIILFVYCSCGEMIADACDVSDAFYQLHWYDYDRKLEISIQIIMARTQKHYKFASCSAINCSLETFAQIVQKAASAFAMLSSL